MSGFQRGKTFEMKVAAMIRKKADSGALRNRGSHANWHRRSDVFTNLPIHVECKDQETVKIKEWFEQADAAASFTQIPTVVFAKDEEVLACLRFNDLLDLFVQVADLQAEIDDLRVPIVPSQSQPQVTKPLEPSSTAIASVVESKVERGAKTCRNGHLADEWGYCMQTSCPYSRGYRKPKGKKK